MAITKSLTASAVATPTATVYTFSSQALGTAASDRYILVGTVARAGSAQTLDSVTVGGVTATLVVKFEDAGSTSGLWLAAVPTGTTGDIVLTYSGDMARAGIAVWRLDGIDTTPTDTGTSAADPATANITIAAGGVAFSSAFTQINTSTITTSWTNLTEDASYLSSASWENNGRCAFASAAFASAQTELALSNDWSASASQSAVFASFAPAAGGGTTITGALGTATASGLTGGVNANNTIAGALGTATASGLQGTVQNSTDTTIAGNLGTATASGLTGTVNANTTIAGTLGVAVASGLQGTVSNTTDMVIGGTLGIAIASGLLGNVNVNRTIAGNLGTAVASGLTGTVQNGTPDTLDLILKILANRQELNPATGTFTLYDNDGTTVLYTTSAWADAAGTVPYSGGALRRIDALF